MYDFLISSFVFAGIMALRYATLSAVHGNVHVFGPGFLFLQYFNKRIYSTELGLQKFSIYVLFSCVHGSDGSDYAFMGVGPDVRAIRVVLEKSRGIDVGDERRKI